MAILNGDKTASGQKLSDMLTASIQTQIPYINKRVNYGKDQITRGSRTQGEITLYVPTSGNAKVLPVTGPNRVDTALDLTGRPRNSSTYKVNCYAQNASDILEYSSFEEIFQIGDVEKELIAPRGKRFAHEIEKDIVLRNVFVSGGAVVSKSPDFAALSKTAAILKSIKAGGDFTGYLSPMLLDYLSTAPLRQEFHVPDEILRGMYGKSSIGIFAGLDWVDEPFMPTFMHESTWTDVTIAAVIDGATANDTKVIHLKGLKAGDVIKAGTPFKIAGVYDVTLAGVKQPSVEKTFIVQKDVTVASATDQAVEVLPMYFNGPLGYTNNLWVDPANDGSVKIAVGTKVTCPLETGKLYYIGQVRDADAFNWTPFQWDKLMGLENYNTSTDMLTLQVAGGGEIMGRSNIIRIDVGYFGDIVDPRLSRTIYVAAE